ncbi:Nucleolar GTP-binding protein 1 [Nymphaea thermarum]|nr:Nucleolar GTP-binding protein 1 [Nymphaea thermarum]
MKSKKMNECLNRFHVAIPKPRDNKEWPSRVPQGVLEARAGEAAAATGDGEEAAKVKSEGRKLEKDLENENGGTGVYSANLKKHYILADDEWKEDTMPEILDGHNVYDFVDSDILAWLEELEREEGLRLQAVGDKDEEMQGAELTYEEHKVLEGTESGGWKGYRCP